MQVLIYSDLNTSRVKRQFEKLREALERNDFKSAEIKKLSPGPYYRAKLDDTNRLLVQFMSYQGQTVCLALEVIHQHAYDKSRFLRGAAVDADKIEDQAPPPEAAPPLRYLNPQHSHFHLLDKVISFDQAQDALFRASPPLVMVGSAGSGKTALTLEKLKQQSGLVAYITLSAYLAQSARNLYFAHHFERQEQEALFLSFREFIETLKVPSGREVAFRDFRGWFERYRQNYRFSDAQQMFEEFRGVLSSQPEGALSREVYLGLGVRQSLFGAERPAVYDLFEKYRQWLGESNLYDTNLLAHQWQPLAQPSYDFVVVDEVQDFTNAQLALVLRTLKHPGQFLLCGDSNQIVHPNFFSWSAVKSLFWRDPSLAERQQLSVLQMNFRNSQQVTKAANTLLKVKHARFGSVDRETNFLVSSIAPTPGRIELVANQDATKRELNQKTKGSTQFAVLVLRDEDKAEARATFQTPLLFSVHEAKGLEYPNVILYNFVGSNRKTFAEISEGVSLQDLLGDELNYSRAKDKSDKGLELYKFYINALYVAISRGVEQVLLIESDLAHPLLQLLGLEQSAGLQTTAQSSREDWEREAQKLELQGKQEQAQSIRQNILKVRPVPWEVWTQSYITDLEGKAFAANSSNKAARTLYEYAVWHQQDALLSRLSREAALPQAQTLFRTAPSERKKIRQGIVDKYLAEYAHKNFKAVMWNCNDYGLDFRTVVGATPLMLAAQAGNQALLEALLERGADPTLTDLFGQNAAMYSLNQAFENAEFAQWKFGPVYEFVAPATLDLQVDDRLVRIYPYMAEYYFFTAMLAGLKTLRSGLNLTNPVELRRRQKGFFVDHLMRNHQFFPQSVLPEERRKRSYVNHVMARAEVNSSYSPARKLWVRVSTGYYLPNPKLKIRVKTDGGEERWEPLLELFALERLGYPTELELRSIGASPEADEDI